MITELTLQNFKSWKLIDKMRFAPITGLFGPNSSGKTSILQFLLMLKQTAESADRVQPLLLGGDRSYVELGTFPEILHDEDTDKSIQWTLGWTLERPFEVVEPDQQPFGGDRLFHSAFIELKSGIAGVTKFAYEFGGQRFQCEFHEEGGVGFRVVPPPSGGFQLRTNPKVHPGTQIRPAKCYVFPPFVFSYFTNADFLAEFQIEFERLFDRVYYLGPLRDYPQRDYTWGGSRPSDVGRRGEHVVSAILASRDEEKIERGEGLPPFSLEEYIAYWLREMKLIYSFEVKSIREGSSLYEVLVQKNKNSKKVLITDVGFGVSQIVPVIALCYYVPKGSTIILEQPEIHLHPSAQAALADVFIDAIKTRNIQIILESHSEHLLRRLQRRIAEETFDSKDATLYFCEFKESESHLTPLELDEFGRINNWPEDFFGDEFGEMAAMTKARIKREMAAER